MCLNVLDPKGWSVHSVKVWTENQEGWQWMVVVHSAQTGGGVPGSNWEEKEGMGWGDWDHSLSSLRSSTRITREGRAHEGNAAGWLDNRAGAFALKETERRREGKGSQRQPPPKESTRNIKVKDGGEMKNPTRSISVQPPSFC